jgi:hypothetical protein
MRLTIGAPIGAQTSPTTTKCTIKGKQHAILPVLQQTARAFSSEVETGSR